jgi:hypothetical protein
MGHRTDIDNGAMEPRRWASEGLALQFAIFELSGTQLFREGVIEVILSGGFSCASVGFSQSQSLPYPYRLWELTLMGRGARIMFCIRAAASTRSSNAKLLSRAMADFATVTPSQGTASNGAADTGGDC